MKIGHLITSLALALTAHAGYAQETLKIGAVYAITGPVAPYGSVQQKGLQMRVDQINAAGGLGGRKVEVIFYDTEGNGNKTVQLVRRAIESDKVDLIMGPSTSGEAMLAGPIANSSKVPMITHTAAQALIFPATPYVFVTAHYDRVSVPIILEEFKRRGFKSVALLSSTDGFGQSGFALLKELGPKYGITINVEEFDRQDTDMTAQVLRARQSNADVMLIWSTFPAPTIIVRNAKALGYNKPIYNSYAMAAQDFLEQAGSAADGTYVMAASMLLPKALNDKNPAKPYITKIHQDYNARYKESPSPSVAHAVDAMYIVEQAVSKIKGPINRQSLRDAIEKTDLFGANGHYMFSATAHGVSEVDLPIVFLKVANKTFTVE